MTGMLFATVLLCTACTREVVVDIAKKGEAVIFTVSRPGSDKPPCIKELMVSLAGASIATTPSLWEVGTAEPGRCVTSFVYGEVPPGFSQSGPAPRLLVGSRYLAEIAGPGLQGGRDFTVRADDGDMTDVAPR